MMVLLVAQSCTKDKCTRELTYTKYSPVIMTADEIRQPIENQPAKELQDPGKIFFAGNYILINEKQKGIHIIDNTDATNPQNIGFVKIIGNRDLAVRNNKLYVDNYMDLLTLDISNINNVSLISRTNNAFTHDFVEGKGIIVDYISEELTETFECENGINVVWGNNDIVDFEDGSFGATNAASAAGRIPGTSVGGSTTRFAFSGDYLYTVDSEDLRVFDISNASNPILINEQSVGFGIETIFPYKESLFLGSTNGVFIFDNSTPTSPRLATEFSHATGCDPVIVSKDYAYVTIHNGTACNGWLNQMDIIDVEDIYQTRLVNTISMESPKGLSIANDQLFVCDNGLKVYDLASDLENPGVAITTKRDINPSDVIALPNGHVVIIGEDGLRQYDASNSANLVELSFIPVMR